MTPQIEGTLALVGVVAVLVAFIWALLSGKWLVLMVGVRVGGYALGFGAAMMLCWALLDVLGRRPVPADLVAVGQGLEQPTDARGHAQGKYAVTVRYTYEADGLRQTSQRYAPVTVWMTADAIAELERQLRADGATAWVSRWDAADSVLDRAVAGRVAAAGIMAFASLALLGLTRKSRRPTAVQGV